MFSGDREAMIELCREVKGCNVGTRGPVIVEAEGWRDLQDVRHDECPAHWPSVA
jgi:hypothetical protein